MVKVLVVDDDTDLLEMVSIVLTSHNMKVTCLNSGSPVLQTMDEARPDIVIMDIYLGDVDGRHVCRELKSLDSLQTVPVILYSAGHIDPVSIKESLADDFITKPFDISSLITKIHAQVA